MTSTISTPTTYTPRAFDVSTPKRTEKGTFLKGTSGNPAGRPKGTKNQITLLRESLELQLREQAAPNLAGVLDKAVELALDGNPGMIKLLLELHMAKSAPEGGKGTEKVAIQINSAGSDRPELKIVNDKPPTED